MITILVTMTVPPADAERLEATLGEMMPLLRETEPETIRFDYYRVDKNAGVYRLLEVYASREALDFHIANPATATQRGILQHLLADKPDLQFLTPLGGK